MNKDIDISLFSKGVDNFLGTTNIVQKKIRIFKLPSIGISGLDTSTIYNIDKISQIIFNFPKGGVYTFSFYLINDNYKAISSICTGTINVISCYESCKTCSQEPNLPNHRCESCLASSQYYTLYKTRNDSIKNCFNSTTILSLEHEYYLYNGFWYECHNKCKKCITLGDDNDNKCTQCQDNYILDYYNINNCVTKCDKYWRREDNKLDHICFDKCNDDYPYEVEDTYECVDLCISANNNGKIYYYYNGKCILKCPDNTLRDRINKKCLSLNYLEDFENGISN